MKPKLSISKRITDCYEYVDRAERSAVNGDFDNSNIYWNKATNIAVYLLDTYESGTFLDEEYDFLRQIAKHIKE